MKRNFFLIFVLILIYGCQNQSNQNSTIEDYIPNSSAIVLRIHSLDVFKSALRNNELLSKTKLQQVLESNLGPLDSLKINGPLLVCVTLEQKQPSYTFITQKKHMANKALLIPKHIQDSVWVFSSSTTQNNNKSFFNHPFKKLANAINENATFSIYVGPSEKTTSVFSIFEDVLLDVNVTPESIAINGIYCQPKSSWAKVFEQIVPKKQQLNPIVPYDVQKFESLVYGNFDQFSKNMQAIDSTLVDSQFSKTLLGTTQEVGHIKTVNGTALAFHSIDINASREALVGFQEKIKTFRSVPIFKFNNDSIFSQSLGVVLPKINCSSYTIIDDYLVFSNQESVLENIISKYINKNSLAESVFFQNTLKKLSDEASFQSTLNPEYLAILLNMLQSTSLTATDLDGYKNSVLQIIKDDELVHINAYIEKFRPTQKQKKISEVFSMTLDAPILGGIQFVQNHQTKQKDIVVQDVENHLYLISNEGVVRWKKKVSGPILGRIQQVDLYKNGRLQLVFSTANKVYVLDRLGRDVDAFPLNFKDEITQAVSVFDYDKNKNYRFLVTQNETLLMYDGNGKRVKGFTYNPEGVVHTAPQHVRYAGKDYIIFVAGNKLNILNRRGKPRIRANESINFSDQNIYFYNNKFTTLDFEGNLIQVDLKGRVSTQSLGFEAQTQITTSSRTLVAQWSNQLQIKNERKILDFGSYLAPQLFYVNDKIYIALTDQQGQKIMLFDSSGTILNGFPVFGISKIDLSNADNDSALEFVCQSGENELMMYQIY